MAEPERISIQLREHQVSLSDWTYGPLARELHRWVEIFDLEFKLHLPSYPVLKFDTLRSAYATFAYSRGDVGTRDNITFNTKELSRDVALILRTECHELLHLWQHYHGTPSSSNYHNNEFRAKALSCGLIVDARGCTSGHTQTFTQLLAKHGVNVEPMNAELPEIALWGARKNETKMKKWRCQCTTVRCATKLNARCLNCKREFNPS